MTSPSLTCREVIEFLYAYREGTLDEATHFAFESHLALCRSCIAYLHTYSRTVELVRSAWGEGTPAEEALPAELVEAVLAARNP